MSITPESVRQLLSSEDLGDRLRAVNQIRELEPTIGFELIQQAINDPNTRVRYSAVSQMDTLGGQDLDLSLEILRRMLKDKEPDVQAAAADCLGALKLVSAFDDLQQIYHNTPEWIVQLSVIATLGVLGEPRGFDLLQEALSSDNELIKITAISSFGELGDLRAVSLLAPYATNPDWQIRHRVVLALNHLGGSEAKSLLETLVDDEVEVVASEAKRNLGNS
ncbi:phycobilisome degradation protein NblB [Calothrix sp. UHCC 0171]|uniref:phycobilisome degradation protein NblB n=1 Tax=Calothrix sp. UHCC 0171 TaxID=3110245 RepID=UPI002B1EDAEE|nr:HEAT repeat domain-containing protein [Calothrix sp. UHCC 0171]MEA5571299.1 HEAT repeat domain-containing protein [Calothrix sp. UHCC 0171]